MPAPKGGRDGIVNYNHRECKDMARKMEDREQAMDLAASKKAAVLRQDKKNKGLPKGRLLALLGVVAAGGLAFWAWGGSLFGQAHAGPLSPATEISDPGEYLKFPAVQLGDGQARFFAVKAPGGVTVRYFLVQDSRGQVHSALDACEVCWRAGLGYEQQGENMVCRNCGRRFSTFQVGQVRGGCNPSPLEPRLEQGQVVLKTSEVLAGKPFFDLTPLRRERRS